MNLLEGLLKLDKEKIIAKETGEIEIKRLSKLTGEPFIVEVQSIGAKTYQNIQSKLLSKNGSIDFSKAFDTNVSLVLAGVTNPDLKSEQLMEHFGAKTPEELAIILFQGGDMTKVADKIVEISGFSDVESDVEEEIKN